MNKLITTLIFIIYLNFNCWGNVSDNPYKLDKIKHIQNSQLFSVMNGRNEWVYDFDGKNPCALIQVKFINMPKDEIRALDYICDINGNKARATIDKLDSEEPSIWVFVTATKKGIFEIVDRNGIKSNRLNGLTFKSKQCYEVTLTCDKRQSINIIVDTEKSKKATIRLDNEKTSNNGEFNDIRLGQHTVQVSVDGSIRLDTIIDVSEINHTFHFDVRPKKVVKIKSNPKGAIIKINGKKLDKSTPLEVPLAHDNYLIEAIISETESDSKTITVNEFTEEVVLNPIRRKHFEVTATYQGQVVPANLYVNGNIYKDQYGNEVIGQTSYEFNEPIGEKLKLRMTHSSGAEKKQEIKIKSDMNVVQVFDLQPRNPITWPWEREYDSDVSGLSFAYVCKQLVTRGEGEQLKENGIWDNSEGEWLHGGQIGMHFQPAFSWGLGLYTGIFCEYYFSFNDNYDYNMYSEWDLYLPIHAYYRIPFGEKIALKVHGGLGLSYALVGAFSQTDTSYGYEDVTDVLGSDYFPSAFNMTLDIGVSFRIMNVQINASYCKGLNDHRSYRSVGNYKTTQNKMSIGASWIINTSSY